MYNEFLEAQSSLIMKKNSFFTSFLVAGISCLSAPFSQAELVDGLIEYWAFDGDYAAGLDASNDGVLVKSGTGDASFVLGKFGSAVDLENSIGNQAVINVGDPAEFAFEAGSMSISAWYTTESLYTDWNTLVSQAEGGNWRIARHGTSGTNFKWSISGPASVAPISISKTDRGTIWWSLTHLLKTVERSRCTSTELQCELRRIGFWGMVVDSKCKSVAMPKRPTGDGTETSTMSHSGIALLPRKRWP